MALSIAVAGKGGTGKTTLASLILTQLLKDDKTPVLAIDADPNANLHEWLGVEINNTIGNMQAEALKKKNDLPAGMDKRRYLAYQMQMCLKEGEGFDLLVMGRTEGPGCYCHVNDILRSYMDELSPNYEYILMDNEAGMEHLSRRTTHDIDHLFIVSDLNPVAVRSAGRIYDLSQDLEINIKQSHLIINRCHSQIPDLIHKEIESTGLELLASVPRDEQIMEYNLNGKSLSELPPDSPARVKVMEFMEDAGLR